MVTTKIPVMQTRTRLAETFEHVTHITRRLVCSQASIAILAHRYMQELTKVGKKNQYVILTPEVS